MTKLVLMLGFMQNYSDDDFPAAAATKMSEYLVKCITPSIKSTKYTSVDYIWYPKTPDVTKHYLICYLQASSSRSIIRRRYPGTELGPSGSTMWSPRDQCVISEIYMDTVLGDSRPDILTANLIYHEFLHNHLDATSHVWQDVHKTWGGNLASAKPITSNPNMCVNAVDVVTMRKALQHPVAQYKGGLPDS